MATNGAGLAYLRTGTKFVFKDSVGVSVMRSRGMPVTVDRTLFGFMKILRAHEPTL